MSKIRICECCKREFLEQDMRGNLCVCCYDFIEEHQDKQVEILEKALELACEELGKVEVFDKEFMECESFYDYFKTKAKEMMKSE